MDERKCTNCQSFLEFRIGRGKIQSYCTWHQKNIDDENGLCPYHLPVKEASKNEQG